MQYRSRVSAGWIGGALAALILGVNGCGGSGGGGHSPSPKATPSITIDWPARARNVGAPASALSCKVTVTDVNNGSTTWSFDRGSNDAAFTQKYSANGSIVPGTCTVSIQFYAQSGTAGAVVASANSTATVTSSGGGLDAVALTGNIASVTVTNQSVEVGKQIDLTCEPKDRAGELIALQPGAVFWTSTGTAATVTATGHATGNSPGTNSITATVDNVASVPSILSVTSASSPSIVCGDPLSVQPVGCTLGAAGHAETSVHGVLSVARVDEMATMGASYLRIPLRHDFVNPTNSTNPADFNFDQTYGPYDTIIHEALAKNMRVILIIGSGYDNPLGSGTNYGVPIGEPSKSVYDAYVRGAVNHYKSASQGHQIIWEVWNEPTSADAAMFGTNMTDRADRFMTLFDDTVAQIRSVDSGAIVAAPTLALYNASDGGSEAFLTECKAKGLLNTPNLMLDVHPGEAASVDPSTNANIDLDPETRWGRDASNADSVAGRLTLDGVRQLAPTTPILISEWSFNTYSGMQAAQMVRSFLCGMDVGATSICVYQYMQEYETVDNKGVVHTVNDRYENNHGLIDAHGLTTPNWTAFQNFATQLKAFTPQGHIQVLDGGHHYRYVFKNAAGATKVVTWSQGGAPYASPGYPNTPKITDQ